MPVDMPARGEVHSLGQAIERLRHSWGWIVAFGAILNLAGLIALGSVMVATLAAVTIVGAMMILGGVAELAMGFRARDWGHFILWILGGLLYVAAGIFVLVNPLLASVVLTLLLGAGLVAAALVRFYLAFQLPPSQPRTLVFLTALVTGIMGIIIISGWPRDSFWVLGLILAIDLMFHGIGWMIFGFWLRTIHRRAA